MGLSKHFNYSSFSSLVELGENVSELDILFYILSGMAVAFGALVVMASSPIYSSLYLVMSMLSVAGIFMTLNAPFIAGVFFSALVSLKT